jgi:hypothetical protein
MCSASLRSDFPQHHKELEMSTSNHMTDGTEIRQLVTTPLPEGSGFYGLLTKAL